MSERATFDDYRNYASLNQRRQQTDTSYALVAVAITILACVVYPFLGNAANYNTAALSCFFHALRDMASRISFGLVKRPFSGGVNIGGDGSALSSVFGLKNSTGLKSLGTDTLRRGIGGIGSLVKGSQSDAPPGLGNWDNSCYQNSVIQGLASLRSLPDFLSKVSTRILQQDSTNIALLETVEKLNDPGYNGKQLWLPSTLKSMSTWQQQDAQEYFSKILDQLDKEAIRASQKASAMRYNLDTEETTDMVTEDTHADTQPLQNPLEGMLAQRVGCKSCGHSDGISLIPFNCLTVPLGHDDLYDIRDCLDEYTKLEEIDGVQCPKCTLLQVKGKLEGMMERATSDAAKDLIDQRLQAVFRALENDDYSDNAITKKCQIPKKQWATSTKTKQAVIARTPKAFVVHVNRSMFNEYTGAQLKNPAAVQFPLIFGLGDWMLGKIGNSETSKVDAELWSMDPEKSMLPEHSDTFANASNSPSPAQYELRAVVTHFGRHENGHYVAYRKHPYSFGQETNESLVDESIQEKGESWWRLSDDDVTRVQQEFVLRQGGVFMLFYERIDGAPSIPESTSQMSSVVAEAAIADLAEAAQTPLPADDMEVDLNLDEQDVASQTPLPEDIADDQVGTPRLSPTLTTQKFQGLTQLLTPPESISGSDFDEPSDDAVAAASYNSRQAKAIPMRTSSAFHDDRGSEESLLSPRMVPAL